MKKFSWILALLAALALIFVGVGCDTGGGGGGEDPDPADWTSAYEPSAEDSILKENLYSTGYQWNVSKAALFNGYKVTKGEEYTLEITFKSSRAVPGGIEIGLVDRVQRGSGDTATFWHPLSWDSDAEEGEEGVIYNTGEIEANVEFTETIKFIAYASSAGRAVNQNDLTFQTQDEYERTPAQNNTSIPAANSPITLTITKFVFSKGEGGTPPELPECECTCDDCDGMDCGCDGDPEDCDGIKCPCGSKGTAAEVAIVDFTKKYTIDLQSKGTDTWATEADDGYNGLKGNLSTTVSDQIRAVNGGKIQIYWVSADGSSLESTNGIGNFGGKGYNATPSGGKAGIATINVGDITQTTGSINLNTYNQGKVNKIIIWEPDTPPAELVEIFNLHTMTGAATTGAFSSGNGLQDSGGTVTWVEGPDGEPALEIERTAGHHGIDLLDSEFEFQMGDVITVKGIVEGADKWCAIIQNIDTSGWEERGQSGMATDGSIVTSKYIIEDEEDLTLISGSAIRITVNGNENDNADTLKLTIYSITIEREE